MRVFPLLSGSTQLSRRWCRDAGDELAGKPVLIDSVGAGQQSLPSQAPSRPPKGIGSVGCERVVESMSGGQAMIGLLGRLGGFDDQVWPNHCSCAVVSG